MIIRDPQADRIVTSPAISASAKGSNRWGMLIFPRIHLLSQKNGRSEREGGRGGQKARREEMRVRERDGQGARKEGEVKGKAREMGNDGRRSEGESERDGQGVRRE